MLLTDQLNRTLSFPDIPERIVSLVPSQTELLVDLGLRDKIVGVTKFCVHPKGLRKSKVVVGGTKNVHYDRIAALKPDLIICNKEENTKDMVEKLECIASVWVSDINNLNQSIDMVDRLGELLNVREKAAELISEIEIQSQVFRQEMINKPFRKVVYLIWKDPYMAVGGQTFVDEMLQLNRFENVITTSRYPEVNLEEMQMADLILLTSEPYPFKEKHARELRSLLKKEVKIVDGEYFSWYGSRLKNAFSYFRTLHT